MKRAMPLLLLLCMASTMALAQGVVGNVLSGDLVNPRKGAWAWYDLKDAATGKAFVVRMAIVDEEAIDSRTGYWFELEVVPLVGYRSVYKMLLTGPAKNPANIHKMIVREGLNEPQEISLKDQQETTGKDNTFSEPDRTSVGHENIKTQGGEVTAEHFTFTENDQKNDIWLNQEVRPMGIVRLKSPGGELTLRNYGLGGPDSRSVINEPATVGKGPKDELKVDVHVEKQNKDKTENKETDTSDSSTKNKPKSTTKSKSTTKTGKTAK